MELTTKIEVTPIDRLRAFPKYKPQIKQFTDWLAATGSELNRESVKEYLDHIKADAAPRSYNLKLTAVKEGIRYLFEHSLDTFDLRKRILLDDFLNDLKPYKLQTVPISEDKILSKDEIERLKKYTSRKQSLIIAFLYHTGLRVSELVDIKLSDIRENGKYFYIGIIGKGDKFREIKCRKDLLNQIREAFQGKKYLFETSSYKNGTEGGKQLSRHYIGRFIRQAGQKYIGKQISPHKLRHSMASHLIKDGVSIKAVSSYLGHSSVKTTLDLYVHDELDFDDLPI